MERMADKMIDTDNALVSGQIEKRMAQLERDKLLVTEKIEKLSKPVRAFDELFEHALIFLANPQKIWDKGNFEDKRNVLKLAFSERLKYSRETGIRTPKTSIPFKTLGVFLDGQNEMAHPRGFEPLASAFGADSSDHR